MTHYILTISSYLQSPITEIVNLVTKLNSTFRSNYASYKTYRSTVKELSRLTDYELLDIGLSRHDVEELARQTAYGRNYK